MKHSLMKEKIFPVLLFTILLVVSCDNLSDKHDQTGEAKSAQLNPVNEGAVYKTESLVIQKLSDHVYKHTSFLSTKDFGNVPCNGMIVIDDSEAIIFDTPTDDQTSGELIDYIVNNLKCKIKGVISTHFHEDCVGGIEKFNEYNIPVYASHTTIDLLGNKDRIFSKPINGFKDALTLHVGDEEVHAEYFGEGHTKDNIIGYFPKERILFGGCLIKEAGAGKGNLEDANTMKWPQTVQKIKQKYSETEIVIPGHGKVGGTELLDYTIKLFE